MDTSFSRQGVSFSFSGLEFSNSLTEATNHILPPIYTRPLFIWSPEWSYFPHACFPRICPYSTQLSCETPILWSVLSYRTIFFKSTPAVCLHLLRKTRRPPPKSSRESALYRQQHNPMSLNISWAPHLVKKKRETGRQRRGPEGGRSGCGEGHRRGWRRGGVTSLPVFVVVSPGQRHWP